MNDPAVKVVFIAVQAVAEEVTSHRIWICTMVLLDIVITINQVNKLLQFQLDEAARFTESDNSSLSLCRQSGFADAQLTGKQIRESLNIEPELKEKRLRSTKRHFGYEATDEPISDCSYNHHKKSQELFMHVCVLLILNNNLRIFNITLSP